MERVAELIKQDLNNDEIIEKFKMRGLEKGVKYKSIEFQDVKIQDGKIIIKIKTM